MAISSKLLAPDQNFDVSFVKNSTKLLFSVNDLLNFQRVFADCSNPADGIISAISTFSYVPQLQTKKASPLFEGSLPSQRKMSGIWVSDSEDHFLTSFTGFWKAN